jgi:colicin import membrane protein
MESKQRPTRARTRIDVQRFVVATVHRCGRISDGGSNVKLRFMMAFAVAFMVSAAHGADDADALKKKRDELQAKQAQVNKQIGEIRKTVEQTDEVKAAQKAAADARAAYDAKVAASANVAAAKKKVDELQAAAKALAETETAGSPEYQAAQKDYAAADDAAFDAESQLRIAQFVQQEMKRKVARDAELKPLKAAEQKAAEAYFAAKQANKDVDVAKAAREAATKAYDEAVSAKLASSADGAAQAKKIGDLEAKVKDTRAAVQAANGKLAAAKAAVAKANPKVAESRKAIDEAMTAQRKAATEDAAAERAAYDKAQRALDEAVRAKLDADPKVVELRKQLDGVRAEMKELTAKSK